MLSFRLNCRWTPCKPLSEHRVISSLCNVVIENHRQMDHLCVKHCQSTEWSLHCSMLSFRLKGRWTPLVNTVRAQSDLFTVQCCHSDSLQMNPCKPLSEHRVISSLCNVVIENHRQMDRLCAKHCQSTESSLHCSMLSFRLNCRWTPCKPLSEQQGFICNESEWQHWTVKRSLCALTVLTKGVHLNTVRAQSDLFTVQCCHSDSIADGLPP